MAKHVAQIGHAKITYSDMAELSEAAKKKYDELEAEISTTEKKLDELKDTRKELANFLGIKKSRVATDQPAAQEGPAHAKS